VPFNRGSLIAPCSRAHPRLRGGDPLCNVPCPYRSWYPSGGRLRGHRHHGPRSRAPTVTGCTIERPSRGNPPFGAKPTPRPPRAIADGPANSPAAGFERTGPRLAVSAPQTALKHWRAFPEQFGPRSKTPRAKKKKNRASFFHKKKAAWQREPPRKRASFLFPSASFFSPPCPPTSGPASRRSEPTKAPRPPSLGRAGRPGFDQLGREKSCAHPTSSTHPRPPPSR